MVSRHLCVAHALASAGLEHDTARRPRSSWAARAAPRDADGAYAFDRPDALAPEHAAGGGARAAALAPPPVPFAKARSDRLEDAPPPPGEAAAGDDEPADEPGDGADADAEKA